MRLPVQRATPSSAALADILTWERVAPVFQPILHLPTGRIVGYEALARGPEGSDLRSPDALFAAPAPTGCLPNWTGCVASKRLRLLPRPVW